MINAGKKITKGNHDSSLTPAQCEWTFVASVRSHQTVTMPNVH